jgi:hypothetical protein
MIGVTQHFTAWLQYYFSDRDVSVKVPASEVTQEMDGKYQGGMIRYMLCIQCATYRASRAYQREYHKTVGASGQSDAYTAALASIEVGLGIVVSAVYSGSLSARVQSQVIHVFTNNRTVLATLRNATRRSGQWTISGTVKHVRQVDL